MAAQMINSGTADPTTGATEVSLKKGVDGIHVINTGATALQIRIPNMTGIEFDTVQPMKERIFRNPQGLITSFYVKTAAANTTWFQGIYQGGMDPDG